MDADKVNRWLTLGANVGVLIGIILILLELNQNAELMRAQMTQARGDNVIQTYRELMISDGWLEIRAKQRAAKSIREWIESLTPTEYERVWYRHLIEFHDLRTQFFQYKSGYLDPRIWETSSRGQARRFMSRHSYFPFELQNFDREFYGFLNEVAQESGLPTVELPE
jgi:hypothetical protein